MTYTAARAIAATKLRTAASIRRYIAVLPKDAPYRRGARDAHRDCIRTARYCLAYAKLMRT